MTDTPATLLEAVTYFSDPRVCFEAMFAVKWPDGKPVCPKCGHDEAYIIRTRSLLDCKKCRKTYSVKVGTIFEDSPLPLQKWFVAIWCIANGVDVSTPALAEALGVTQKTAWSLLHRVKLAMQTMSYQASDGLIFAPVPGFAHYRAGSDGSVWSDWSGDWQAMSPTINSHGYRHVDLRGDDGRKSMRKVAVIVLESFAGPRPYKAHSRHLDGNSRNDAIANLAWGSAKENAADKQRHGTVAKPLAKFSAADLAAIVAMRGVRRWQDVAAEFGISKTHIYRLWRASRCVANELSGGC